MYFNFFDRYLFDSDDGYDVIVYYINSFCVIVILCGFVLEICVKMVVFFVCGYFSKIYVYVLILNFIVVCGWILEGWYVFDYIFWECWKW